jgi:hypothetical protein
MPSCKPLVALFVLSACATAGAGSEMGEVRIIAAEAGTQVEVGGEPQPKIASDTESMSLALGAGGHELTFKNGARSCVLNVEVKAERVISIVEPLENCPQEHWLASLVSPAVLATGGTAGIVGSIGLFYATTTMMNSDNPPRDDFLVRGALTLSVGMAIAGAQMLVSALWLAYVEPDLR